MGVKPFTKSVSEKDAKAVKVRVALQIVKPDGQVEYETFEGHFCCLAVHDKEHIRVFVGGAGNIPLFYETSKRVNDAMKSSVLEVIKHNGPGMLDALIAAAPSGPKEELQKMKETIARHMASGKPLTSDSFNEEEEENGEEISFSDKVPSPNVGHSGNA